MNCEFSGISKAEGELTTRKKRFKFKEERIIRALKEADAGMAVAELCRKQEICEQTYYRWKSKH